MAGDEKNGGKRQQPPNYEATTFSSGNQPSGEAKSKGWQEMKAKRLLTQEIIKQLTEGTNLSDYVTSLRTNAAMGNAKAIETLNRGMEDEITKVAQTTKDGDDIQPALDDKQLTTLLTAIRESKTT